ncbi:MAG: carbonic anhydrase [Firmicutes bacterium]|nr:carbonic anhydrase [Bacillota bacterium]
MSLLDEILDQNTRFVAERERSISRLPTKRIAIFTCMDTRLVDFLEPAMGLKRGDAMVIKNAGNTLVDPSGGVIRSLVVAIYELECREVYVIGHRDCGMARVNEADLERKMGNRGVSDEAIAGLQPSLRDWLGAFRDPYGNVRRVVETIRQSPLIPVEVPIHGLIFDPHSGRLELIVDGRADRG